MVVSQSVVDNVFKKILDNLGKCGGPFGAAILDAEGNPVVIEINRVIELKDPTAHAEITAIRAACQKLGTSDLTGYALYTSCYPCPMCLAAASWANIKEIYYCGSPMDADGIGFRDDKMYEYIHNINDAFYLQNNNDKFEVFEDFPVLYRDTMNSDRCSKVFKLYEKIGGIIY